jgi:hypothetical protein
MTRSPENTQQKPTTEFSTGPTTETPLFDQLQFEYLKSGMIDDLEAVTSDSGAAVAVLLEGQGTTEARSKYMDLIATIPAGATHKEIPVYLEMSYHVAQSADRDFKRPAAVYQADDKMYWNASAAEGTTGLAVVSIDSGERLGVIENAGVITEVQPDHKVVIADNELLDRLQQHDMLNLRGIANVDKERELYPAYGAVIVDFNDSAASKPSSSSAASGKKKKQSKAEAVVNVAARAEQKRLRDLRRARLAGSVTSVSVNQADNEAVVLSDQPDTHTVNSDDESMPPLGDRRLSMALEGFTDAQTATIMMDVIMSGDSTEAPSNDGVDPRSKTSRHATNSSEQPPLERDAWKDNVRHPLAYLASRLSVARFMAQNKREAQGLSRERFDSSKTEKRLKIALGAVAVGLVAFTAYRLGSDAQASGDLSGLPVFNGESEVDREAARQAAIATEHARELAAQHAEILNSPVQIIPDGGGGEAYTLTNGVNAGKWYHNQDEFLRLFPNDAYRMGDGNVGFKHPGELSDGAKEYWARKFGKWL